LEHLYRVKNNRRKQLVSWGLGILPQLSFRLFVSTLPFPPNGRIIDHSIEISRKFSFLGFRDLKWSFCSESRVTRLGEFSPKEWMFFFGKFFENCRSSPHLLTMFLVPWCTLCINFDKNVFGYTLGDFFHKPIRSHCPRVKIHIVYWKFPPKSVHRASAWPQWAKFRHFGKNNYTLI
jgi:hypothetical protein